MKKTNIVISSVIAMALTIGLSSCGGGGSETKTEAVAEQAVAEAPAKPQDNPYALGEKIFSEKCVVCHQANGQGISGAFPSLLGSEFLKNNRLGAVSQVLNGTPGGSVINGVKYSAPMPPQVDTKEEAVAVINYVANHFGNEFGLITIEDVKDVVINPR
jgi:nitrite reductase (NO-forming)